MRREKWRKGAANRGLFCYISRVIPSKDALDPVKHEDTVRLYVLRAVHVWDLRRVAVPYANCVRRFFHL